MNETVKEAKRLYALGFAIHWLHPQSKIPLESGWGSGPRKPWKDLLATHHDSYNIGVRLGTPSKIGDNYLAVIDVDVKSLDPKHRKEALDAAKKLIGSHDCPTVLSGRGGGSRHYYCVTGKPFKTFNPAVSKEMVKYLSPSKTKISQREREQLSEKEIKEGYRLSHAWEISLYSDGRQVVLPPSIHPDSGKSYLWKSKCDSANHFPLLEFSIPENAEADGKGSQDRGPQETIEDFEITSVQLDWLPCSKDLVSLIKKGFWKGRQIENRSDYLLVAATGLHSAGCSRDDILTVLTERDYFLGEVGFEHSQSSSRKRAAQWLWNYTVKKVLFERDAKRVFRDAADTPLVMLDEAAALKQKQEIKKDHPWQQDLQRAPGDKEGPGKILNTLVNVHLILENAFGPALFKFNEFSKLDEIWQKTPWGAKVGTEFQERDVQKIKLWISQQFGFQTGDENIWSALINIADTNAYHPIKEYFLGLPVHDGVERVDYFLERYLHGEAPEKYIRAVSRKTIVAMIARIFEPGIKFDTMLVLEGEQGLRKSTAIMTLTSKPWFTDANLNLKHKDSIADMAGKWVLEQGEMNVLSKANIAELKQFLSRDTDRMRPSFGRKSQDYPRQSIFIGTTNEDIYLKDTTGSRRFWPIKVTGNCDVKAITKDRDQIFAEALAMYRAGEPIWISDEDTNHLAKKQQAERETSDELVYVIEDYLKDLFNKSDFDTFFDPTKLFLPDLFVTPSPLAVTGSHFLKMDDNGQKRVGSCLRKMGYERKVVKENGKTRKAWVKLPRKEEKLPVGVTENE